VDGTEHTQIVSLTPGDHVITWAHRNRLNQMDQLVGYTAASGSPEMGQTYEIDLEYSGLTIRTVSGITDDTWTYTSAMQTSDGNPPQVLATLRAVRSGLSSFSVYSFPIPLTTAAVDTGWGNNFGESWGE
jgi:hypothetical protein